MKMASNFLTSQSSTYMYVYNYNQLTNESPIIKKEKHCHHKLFRKFSVFVCVITPWICMMYFYDPNFMLNILLEIIWYKAEEIILSLNYFQLMQRVSILQFRVETFQYRLHVKILIEVAYPAVKIKKKYLVLVGVF